MTSILQFVKLNFHQMMHLYKRKKSLKLLQEVKYAVSPAFRINAASYSIHPSKCRSSSSHLVIYSHLLSKSEECQNEMKRICDLIYLEINMINACLLDRRELWVNTICIKTPVLSHHLREVKLKCFTPTA